MNASPSQMVEFECNICSGRSAVQLADLQRENRSCSHCGSSVRMRAIIHCLSVALFGKSLAIRDFPVAPRLKGIGMSDWTAYASRLRHKLGYINTFYHKEPYFDVTHPEKSPYRELDFVISTDVFEHVAPPVSAAFSGAAKVLKDQGTLILTVPYVTKAKETVEHFPDLFDYRIAKEGGQYVLYNTTSTGELQQFRDLKFHGGPGETLEMRLFSLHSLLQDLRLAGFTEIEVVDQPVIDYGIYWAGSWSLPIVARQG